MKKSIRKTPEAAPANVPTAEQLAEVMRAIELASVKAETGKGDMATEINTKAEQLREMLAIIKRQPNAEALVRKAAEICEIEDANNYLLRQCLQAIGALPKAKIEGEKGSTRRKAKLVLA